jgi:galactose mutarotase-like enzyme
VRYVLSRGNWRAVVDTLGAELISCKEKDLEYVWSGSPQYWTGHAPVLFPVVCALRNDRTSFGGMPYAMKQHGFARKSEFAAVLVAEDQISMKLIENDETLSQYPFPFGLIVSHKLTDNGFETTYTVQNTGTGVLPFAIGGHAGFACPLKDGEKFSDYDVVFDREEDPTAYLLNEKGLMSREHKKKALTGDGKVLPLSYNMFDESALVFLQIQSRKLSLVHRQKGTGLDFYFHNFCNFGIWTPPGKEAPFICLEPWQGIPSYEDDAWIFEEKADVVFLPAGEIFKAGYGMRRRR